MTTPPTPLPTTLLITLLAEAYAAVTTTVEGCADEDFTRPTRTEWTVAELLWHQCLDATRALAAFSTLVDGPADVDAVTYWAPFRPDEGDGGAAHAAYVRVATSAFQGWSGLVGFWTVVGPAAARAAAAADPATYVSTQGHVLAVPDFVSTLLVETTVHLLDLTVDLPAAPAPATAALAETRRVLDALGDRPLPAAWEDTEAALKATGRTPLTDADRADLGPAWRPLLG